MGELTSRGLRVLSVRFTENHATLVARVKSHAANARLAKHLENHLADLFTFLREPAVDATNWRSEHASDRQSSTEKSGEATALGTEPKYRKS
ncbi:MAG: hypothetical protein ACI8P0_002199 [Planctomycetaceae bacterium]|jgi:hypothetical protein